MEVQIKGRMFRYISSLKYKLVLEKLSVFFGYFNADIRNKNKIDRKFIIYCSNLRILTYFYIDATRLTSLLDHLLLGD